MTANTLWRLPEIGLIVIRIPPSVPRRHGLKPFDRDRRRWKAKDHATKRKRCRRNVIEKPH